MVTRLTIRVHHPDAAALELRTERAWDAVIAPSARGAGRAEFALSITESFLRFKPVLRTGEKVVWARGENYLAVPGDAPRLDVHPAFPAEVDADDDGAPRIERHNVPSADGTRAHEVTVLLPAGHHDPISTARYPVLYMQDGQNLFSPDEAFGGHTWGVPETARALDAMRLVREFIVVGVRPEQRDRDYTQPGYADYARFLAHDLKPFVDARYKTRREARHTAVLGSSLGGVAALATAWQHPDAFGAAACMSSTFGFADDLLARVAREPRRPVRIYLDSGWPNDNYEVTQAMRSVLLRRGHREGDDLLYLAFPNATHGEDAWKARLHIPLQFLFGRRERRPDQTEGRLLSWKTGPSSSPRAKARGFAS